MSLQNILSDCKQIGSGSLEAARSLATGSRQTASGLARGSRKAGKGLASLYRHLADPLLPYVDRVAYPAAAFAGGNLALSQAIYHANQLAVQPGLEGLLGEQGYEKMQQVLDSNSYLEAGMKVAALGTVYGLANWKLIYPAMRRLWNRKTCCSWLSHARTWAVIGASALALNASDILDDCSKAVKPLKQAQSITEIASGGANALKLMERYATGASGAQMLMALTGVPGPNTSHDSRSREDAAIDRQVKQLIQRHLKNEMPRFRKDNYAEDISAIANKYVRQGYVRNPEEFVYVVRAIYFEGAFDKKGGNDLRRAEQRMKDITCTIYHRFLDNLASGQRIYASSETASLHDIVKHKSLVTKTVNEKGKEKQISYWRYAFTCIRDKPEYFINKDEPGWNMYSEDGLRIAVGSMDKARSGLALNAICAVIDSKGAIDKTGGALFYQNPEESDRFNSKAKWKTWAVPTREYGEHVYFVPKNPNLRLTEDKRKWAHERLAQLFPSSNAE